jgi:hypothetical protein
VALIDDVFQLCQKLSDDWSQLLTAHGLNIRQPDPATLANELLNQNLKVNRNLPGFQDFADDVARGIVPGRPSQSLFYHALASPNVVSGIDGRPLRDFPKLDEIEIVENYVFGVHPPTVEELLARSRAEHLSVVVFAYEYRPASQTCHRKHADLVFSRTGIARVGTKSARYVPVLRGYLPEPETEPTGIHVSPARYAVFLAVRRFGDRDSFLPMRYRDGRRDDDPSDWIPDDQRPFWVPLHKLFPGRECLRATDKGTLNLTLTFDSNHSNEKLLRLHTVLGRNPSRQSPYVLTEDLAALVASAGGTATIMPTPHNRLVDEAHFTNGDPLTFTVPKTANASRNDKFFLISSSLGLNASNGPAYVHIRTEVKNGRTVNLNEDLTKESDFFTKLQEGNYEAQNYVDFTAEGWVTVTCPELNAITGIDGAAKPAYSLVCAPDFYPSCDQRELTEWTGSTSVPTILQEQIWNIPPDTLCDVRLLPNLQLNSGQTPFDKEETITALVSLLDTPVTGVSISSPATLRHSHLPDDAAGVFAPGWDVSRDTDSSGNDHLAGYALGSPFPEDSKLCAALSTFWPAVAPDATREMEPYQRVNQSGTVSPMTDEEIGLVGGISWDGVGGPHLVMEGGQEFADYPNFHRVDYVRNTLDNDLTMRLTAQVDAPEYQQRVLALAYGYLALGAERTGNIATPTRIADVRDNSGTITQPGERRFWKVLSFQAVTHASQELMLAEQEAKTNLSGRIYRCIVYSVDVSPSGQQITPVLDAPDFRRKRVAVNNKVTLFVSPAERKVLLRNQQQLAWHQGVVLV